MILNIDHDYDLGVFASLEPAHEEYFHGENDIFEVEKVYVDTANNPTKTTDVFGKVYEWNSHKVKTWIERKMNE